MSHSDLDGKVVVVTGASRGIGADTAIRLARDGARVVCAARTLTEGDHILAGSLEGTVEAIRTAGGMAIAVSTSLERDESCEQLIAAATEAYGPVDILVNNAAVAFFGPAARIVPSRWLLSWRVTCHAPFLLSQLVLPMMIERGGGRIINISSESAVGPGPGPYDLAQNPVGDVAYGAQKAMIERLTQGWAAEVYKDGVGIACVAPSQIVPTPGAFFNGHISGDGDGDRRRTEPSWYMPEAIHLLATAPLESVSGRVVYSQQLLLEHGIITAGAGLGVDPDVRTSGFSCRPRPLGTIDKKP